MFKHGHTGIFYYGIKMQGYLLPKIKKLLDDVYSQPVEISEILPINGGETCQAFKVETSQQTLFLKVNSKSLYPKLFENEAKGLKALDLGVGFKVPQVVAEGTFDDVSYLILEYVEKLQPGKLFEIHLGKALANLHREQSDRYGLDYDNHIAYLPQVNTYSEDWIEFFTHHRLNSQLDIAKKNKSIDNPTIKAFDKLMTRLSGLLHVEAPTLIHGDLWNGNVMCTIKDTPCLYDPAVYYGNREVDIASTKLFSGFGYQFYDSYEECFPLEKGWEERIEIYNLYFLLVHLNIFGNSYLHQIKRTLQKFV